MPLNPMEFILADQIETVKRSCLFDTQYYIEQSPESVEFEDGPIAHYLLKGYLRGFDPHPLFDTAYYLRAADYSGDRPALLHHLGKTGAESISPHPLFDCAFYLKSNEDLQKCAELVQPLVHYVQDGATEGRDPHALFSTDFYYRQMPELREQKVNPLVHYLCSAGESSPHELFDVSFYKSVEPGLKGNPLTFFLQKHLAPHNEFVSPHPIFDSRYYLAQLPPSERNCANPLLHFLMSEDGKVSSPHPLFDVKTYLQLRWDVVRDNSHAFMHYIRHGYLEGYEPNRLFHSLWYLQKHPELAEAGANPLLHYVLNPGIPHPLFAPAESFFDLPILGSAACREKQLPIAELDIAYDALMQATEADFTRVFIILALTPGVPGRILNTNITALQKRHGIQNVLVIYSYATPQSEPPVWLPLRSRAVDLNSLYPEDFPTAYLASLLVAAMLSQRTPQAVHICESYQLLALLGAGIGLMNLKSRYLLNLYGHGVYLETLGAKFWLYSINGPSVGTALRNFDCIITDTDMLRRAILNEVIERHNPNKKTITLRALTPTYIDHLLSIGGDRKLVSDGHILWASRLAKEKRPDILCAIATRLPEQRFLVYGSITSDPVSGAKYLEALKALPNVTYMGAYTDFAELQLKEAIAFLYTTETDGVPLVLEEATAMGLPVIAPRVGGIPEFITDDTGWTIADLDDIDGYAKAIQNIKEDTVLARQRVLAGQALLRLEYGQAALVRELSKIPEFY